MEVMGREIDVMNERLKWFIEQSNDDDLKQQAEQIQDFVEQSNEINFTKISNISAPLNSNELDHCENNDVASEQNMCVEHTMVIIDEPIENNATDNAVNVSTELSKEELFDLSNSNKIEFDRLMTLSNESANYSADSEDTITSDEEVEVLGNEAILEGDKTLIAEDQRDEMNETGFDDTFVDAIDLLSDNNEVFDDAMDKTYHQLHLISNNTDEAIITPVAQSTSYDLDSEEAEIPTNLNDTIDSAVENIDSLSENNEQALSDDDQTDSKEGINEVDCDLNISNVIEASIYNLERSVGPVGSAEDFCVEQIEQTNNAAVPESLQDQASIAENIAPIIINEGKQEHGANSDHSDRANQANTPSTSQGEQNPKYLSIYKRDWDNFVKEYSTVTLQQDAPVQLNENIIDTGDQIENDTQSDEYTCIAATSEKIEFDVDLADNIYEDDSNRKNSDLCAAPSAAVENYSNELSSNENNDKIINLDITEDAAVPVLTPFTQSAIKRTFLVLADDAETQFLLNKSQKSDVKSTPFTTRD